MVKLLNTNKRSALLEAAINVVAENGLSATTASIAKAANVASGTLFTYFPTKVELLNEVYLMLKIDMAEIMLVDYPKNANIRDQIIHVWRSYTGWSLGNLRGKQVLRLLSVSEILIPETLEKIPEELRLIDKMFDQAIENSMFITNNKEFIYTVLLNIADATIDQIIKQPKNKEALLQLGFQMLWNAITQGSTHEN